MSKKKWSKQDIFYLKEYTGKYSNKFLAKKLNTSIISIYAQQQKHGITIKGNFAGHDFITQTKFTEELGLTLDQMKVLKKNKFITFKKLGTYVAIKESEIEKVKEFYQKYLPINRATKILNMKSATLRKKIRNGQFESTRIGKNIKNSPIFVNKEQILNYKKLLNETYTVKEVSELTYYDCSTITKKIKKKEIEAYNDFGIYRIYKTEIKKIKK